MVNLRIITKDDFVKSERGIHLKGEAIKKFVNQFETEMNRKGSNHTLSLKENIYVQVAVIKKWILDNSSFSFYNWKV